MHTTKTNSVKNQLTGVYDAVPAVARAYKAAGVASIVVEITTTAKDLLGSMLLWNLVSLE
jgi:hypothetical protein